MSRDSLGDFSSVICLKAIITGMEDILGERTTGIALVNAGKIRGRKVALQLGITDDGSVEGLGVKLGEVLGADGTRLCIIDDLSREGDALVARTRETVCSADEPQGSPRVCSYTLGVVWGALEQVLQKKLRGVQSESVLRGGTHDVFRFVAL